MAKSAQKVNGSIHFAKLDTSPRLQKLLMHLSDGAEHTTYEIFQKTHLCAVNSAITELRRNNIPVTCRRLGQGLFSYQLTELANTAGWLICDGREAA